MMARLLLLATICLIVAISIVKMIPATLQISLAPVDPTLRRMRGVSYIKHGDVSVLRYSADLQRPAPLPWQVLVHVHYAAINPCDFKLRRMSDLPKPVADVLLPKPKIPGEDLAGIVVAVGSDVSRFRRGDRVAAMLPILGARWGALSEFVAVDEAHAALVPDQVSLLDAASIPLVALTVVQALDRTSPSGKVDLSADARSADKPKQTALVQAGGGGVGTFAVQILSRVLGFARVDATCSESCPLVKALAPDGVVKTIDYRVESATPARGYDVVLDPMSWRHEAATLAVGAGVLKEGSGHYLNILSSDWALDAVTGKEAGNGLTTLLHITHHGICHVLGRLTALVGARELPEAMGCRSTRYSAIFVSPNGKRLAQVLQLLHQERVHAVVDSVFPLEEAQAAFEKLEKGHARGKILLRIGGWAMCRRGASVGRIPQWKLCAARHQSNRANQAA
jgi:alcohol dehydrogenase